MSKMKKTKCICNWPDCAELQEQCTTVLPKKHPWNTVLRRIRRSIEGDGDNKIENEAFINLYFSTLSASSDQPKDDFYIALHYSSKLCLKVGTLNKTYSAATMRQFDNDAIDGCVGHCDNTNLVSKKFRLF